MRAFSNPYIFHKIFEKLPTDYLQSELIWLENAINFPEMFEGLWFKFIFRHLIIFDQYP